MSEPVDVMVLAAHPDDAEIGCAGTLLRLTDAGRRVAVVDMTRGEVATRGTPEQREQEARAASEKLGLATRQNLGLPDGRLADDEVALRAVVGALRSLRPRLLLAPWPVDAHPDHVATAHVARRAFFHAGLVKVFPEAGAPHRPRVLLRYPGNDGVTPTLCIDIGAWAARKREIVACYDSQLARTDAERAHFVRGLDPLERCEARDRYFGSLCGYTAAEPFVAEGPVPLDDLDLLVARPGGTPT